MNDSTRAEGPASRCTVTRAEFGDLERLVPLFDAYRRFYGQESAPALGREFLRERLSQGQSVLFLASGVLAGAEQQALGFSQLYPSFSSVSLQRLWILNDLFVVPGARKQGVGAELLAAAEQFARETQAKGLVLSTQHGNWAAQSLYRRAGYAKDNDFAHYALYLPPAAGSP